MSKLDLKKLYKHLYRSSGKRVSVVEVPSLQFVMIDGAIETGMSPNNSPGFEARLGALYSMAYTLKFMSKQREVDPIDYTVMRLEGLWWVEDGRFDIAQPDNWMYTLMILQPDHINEEMFSAAMEIINQKKPGPMNQHLRLERFHEGLSLQIMHIGPFADEMQTIQKIDAFAAENGYEMHGKHHEIYMSDPRRTAPEKLKTILRHPAKRIRQAVTSD